MVSDMCLFGYKDRWDLIHHFFNIIMGDTVESIGVKYVIRVLKTYFCADPDNTQYAY